MSEQGGIFMQMIGGVASEKCRSFQVLDLMMNEFGLPHRLESGVANQTTSRKLPSCPVSGEKLYFTDGLCPLVK